MSLHRGPVGGLSVEMQKTQFTHRVNQTPVIKPATGDNGQVVKVGTAGTAPNYIFIIMSSRCNVPSGDQPEYVYFEDFSVVMKR